MSTKRGPGDRLDRRPTKAERKEQARLEREQIQRRMAARKRNRSIGLVLVALAAIAIVVTIFVLRPGGTDLPSPDQLLQQAPAAAEAAGCQDVETIGPFDPETDDRTHIGGTPSVATPPPLSSYPSVPPVSGPHAPIPPGPATAGVYDSPPDIYRAIHSLEHAGVIVWYSPDAPDSAISQIEAFYSQGDNVGQGKVIVAPYDYPGEGDAGVLPGGAQFVIAAWHHLRTCASPSLAVAFDFSSQFVFPPFEGRPYSGDAPEPNSAI